MKKQTLLFILLSGFVFVLQAQDPQWLNYTNGDVVQTVAAEGDVIWIGTNGGLVEYDKITGDTKFYNKANSGLHANGTGSIAIDENGTKWMACAGLTSFDGINWTTYNTVNSGLPSTSINDIALDGNDTKWICTNEGLAVFDDSDWVVYNTSNSGLPHNYIITIDIDQNGTKWIGTLNGFAAYNENGIPIGFEELTIDRRQLEVTIFPNPAKSIAFLEYTLKNPSLVSVKIFDLNGREVKTLVNGMKLQGKQSVSINTTGLNPGIYFCTLKSAEGMQTKKLIKME